MSDRLAVMSDGHIEQIGAPAEIYERPVTRFVAGFIGTSNIIDSSVVGRDGDHVRLAAGPDDQLLVRAGAVSGPAGSRVCLTVRPEKVVLTGQSHPVPPGYCSLRGVVEDVVYQGVSTQYVVRMQDDSTLVAFRQNSETVTEVGSPGAAVCLQWNADQNVVLEQSAASTEEAVSRS